MSYVCKAFLLSPFMRNQGSMYVTKPNNKDLVILKGLIESGKVTPVIDRTYPLEQIPEALDYAQGGHAKGKVVISVGQIG